MICLLGGMFIGFVLGVVVGWAAARSVLPARIAKGVAAMRHRIWEWIGRHTVGIVLVTVIVCTVLVIVNGYLYSRTSSLDAHKDDFQHCVNVYIAKVSKAQAPRAKANVNLQKAQKAWVAHPTEANRLAYLAAYDAYDATVKKYPIPPAPPCLTGAKRVR